MFWGIECPDGWYSLLYAMCAAFERIQDEYDITVVADQVKEKYGSLRFSNHIEYGDRWTLEGGRQLFDGQEFTRGTFRHGWEGLGEVDIKLTDAVDQRVDYVENRFCDMSSRICARCGTTGNFENPMGRTTGWTTNICKACNGENSNWKEMYGPKKEDEE